MIDNSDKGSGLPHRELKWEMSVKRFELLQREK